MSLTVPRIVESFGDHTTCIIPSMSNSNADMLSKPERFWRGRWLPKFLLKHRTVHSPAGSNPRAQNRPRIPFQSEVPASDVTEYSEISDRRSFTGPLRTSPGLNVPPVGAGKDPAPIATGDDQKSAKHYTPINAKNVNSSGIEMQVLNHSDTDAIRHGISGNEKGKGKEATAGTLKTSSTPQDNVELPPQPMQSQNVGDTFQEDISSSSVLRDITSMPMVNGEPDPSREESAADAISSHKQHAFASKGHVDPEQSLIGALSPPQDPKRRDIPPKQGPRNSQPDNGSSVIQPQGLPTSKTQDFKGKREEESQPRQLSQRAFASLRQRIDGHVKLIEGEYKRKNKGVGSNWITVLENGTIVIKCEHESFTERVQRKVKESEFFKRFPKILVKHDPDAAGTWVAESSEFFTGTLQSNQYPLTGTIGGIVLVDGKPFGLTAAHGIYVSQHMKGSKSESQDESVKRNRESDDTTEPFSTATRPTKGNREAFTSWDGHTGEVVAYRFSRTLVSNTPFPKNSENFGLSDAADWALVELDGEEIPMNTVLAGWLSPKSFHVEKTEKLPSQGNALEMDRDATEELLWRRSYSDSVLKPVLIKDILTEGEFANALPHHNIERVRCVLVTPSSIINGSFGYGYSTFSMYGACFSVLRVDLESPLVDGDSGSWVFVGHRLFGMIIARSGRTDSPVGYLIPMEEVFRSISLSLSAEVRLPSQRDYKLNLIRSRQKQHRWLVRSDSDEEQKWETRMLEIELLLAHAQAEKGSGRARVVPGAHISDAITVDHSLLSLESPWLPHRHLHHQGFSESTISSVLLLGDVFPIQPNARAEIISKIQGNRKLTHPQVYHQNIRPGDWVADELLRTPGGQNVLIMFIFLWAIFREQKYRLRKMRSGFSWTRAQTLNQFGDKTKGERLIHIAEIFSAIFAARGIPASRTPSSSELENLIGVIIRVYRSKEIPRIMTLKNTGMNFRRLNWEESAHGEIGNHEAIQISQLLIKLSSIAEGDRSQVLVCEGVLQSLPIYAAYMLGLDTEIRRWHPEEGWEVQRRDRYSRDPPLVIIYRNPPWELELNGSELIARDKIDSDWGDQYRRTGATSIPATLQC